MPEERIQFLVAEDEPTVRSLVCTVLSERDYRDVAVASDGLEAIEQIKARAPDILITDIMMPRMDGEELSRKALEIKPDLTILVTTGNGTIESAVRMMKNGIFDFITKPFSIDALMACIERGVARTRNLAELNGARDTIEALMAALESKDIYLRGHSRRVSALAGFLANKLGWPRKRVRLLEYAALVHDIGKIGIQEQILNKPGPLTPDETDQMRRHPWFSREILRPVAYLQEILPDIYHHHERYDGRGYPDGLQGEGIPIGARIISLADSYDAMASDRAYRLAMGDAEILAILKKCRGSQFDPALVDLFLENFQQVKALHDLDRTAIQQH